MARHCLEVTACHDWTLLPPTSTSPPPACRLIDFLKALVKVSCRVAQQDFPLLKLLPQQIDAARVPASLGFCPA